MKTIILLASMFIINTHSLEKRQAYVCMGPNDQYYHLQQDCKALEKCKYEVKKMDEYLAKDMERRICKLCKENSEKK